MSTKEQYWKYSLIAIIIGLGIILFRQIAPFMGGLLGALTIYILVRKQMMYLSDKRKMKRSIAATLITAEPFSAFWFRLGWWYGWLWSIFKTSIWTRKPL